MFQYPPPFPMPVNEHNITPACHGRRSLSLVLGPSFILSHEKKTKITTQYRLFRYSQFLCVGIYACECTSVCVLFCVCMCSCVCTWLGVSKDEGEGRRRLPPECGQRPSHRGAAAPLSVAPPHSSLRHDAAPPHLMNICSLLPHLPITRPHTNTSR